MEGCAIPVPGAGGTPLQLLFNVIGQLCAVLRSTRMHRVQMGHCLPKVDFLALFYNKISLGLFFFGWGKSIAKLLRGNFNTCWSFNFFFIIKFLRENMLKLAYIL